MSAEYHLTIHDHGNGTDKPTVDLVETGSKNPLKVRFYKGSTRPNSEITENQRYKALLYYLATLQHLSDGLSTKGSTKGRLSVEQIFNNFEKELEQGKIVKVPSESAFVFLIDENIFLELYLKSPVQLR